MYERRTSADGERDEEPPQRRPRAATSADVLVRLQQTGGNQAVTRMLGGSRAVLARYGVRVLMDTQAASPVVTGVDVIGRPKLRLIPGGEGSHVTAWAVFADVVRRTIVGQQLDPALATMQQLLRDQRASLEAAWADPRPRPVAAGLKQAETALEDLAAADGGAKLSRLQEVIDAYLTLHNLRPGTAVMIGKAQAIGAGEPRHLSALRQFEVSGLGDTGVLRSAIFGLVDTRALAFIGGLRAANATAPGIDPADTQRIGAAVLRGLEDLAAAYPRSYAAAITDAGVVTAWLQSEFLPHTLPGPIPVAPAAAPARAGWSRTGVNAATDVGKRNALCQIVLSHDGDMTVDDDQSGEQEPVVDELRFAGRPKTLTKNEQGHHTVAWKLELLRLESLLVGATLADAAHALVDVSRELLDELELGLQWLAGEDIDVSEEEFRQYSRLALGAARDALDAQVSAINPDGNDTLVVLHAAQDLANAWMNGVNVLPLGAADIGAPANGRGEGTAIGRLREFERAAPAPAGKRRRDDWYEPEHARDDLMALLDTKAVSYLHVADQSGLAYPADQDQRVIVIVKRFLRAAHAAFPKALEHSGINTPDGVRRLIDGLRTSVDDIDDAVDAVFDDGAADPGPDLDLGDDEGDNPRPLKVRIGIGPDGRFQVIT